MVIGVVVGSLLPGEVVSRAMFHDKLEHGFAYALLMVWFAGFYRRGLYLAVGGVLIALGLGLEVVQGFTRTRTFDWYDLLADSVGILAGVALAFWFLGGWCQRVEQRLLS
jgi:VanZ family protein